MLVGCFGGGAGGGGTWVEDTCCGRRVSSLLNHHSASLNANTANTTPYFADASPADPTVRMPANARPSRVDAGADAEAEPRSCRAASSRACCGCILATCNPASCIHTLWCREWPNAYPNRYTSCST